MLICKTNSKIFLNLNFTIKYQVKNFFQNEFNINEQKMDLIISIKLEIIVPYYQKLRLQKFSEIR